MPMPYTTGYRTLTIFFEDFNSHDARHELRFLQSTDISDVRAYAETYCQRLADVIEAGITGYNITDRFWYTDPDAPSATSDVTDTCTLILQNSASGRNQVVVPAINPSLLVSGGSYDGLQLDDTNTTVQAYVAELANFCGIEGDTHTSLLTSIRERGRLVR